MTSRQVLIVLTCIVACAGSSVAGTPAENKALIEEVIAVGNSRDFDQYKEFIADNFVRHCQATPGLVITSRDQFREFMEADVKVCPDSMVEIHQLIAEGDRVALWGSYIGTQEGVMGPFPPSGKKMVLDFAGVFRIEGGKIAELWVTWDNMAALSQLGHYPPPNTE
ncbi:MAG: ester cyclase [bacterium]|nr:ester cyclase [bacterium]